MIIHFVRVLFLVAVLAITVSFTLHPDIVNEGAEFVTLCILLPTAAAVVIVLVDMLWRRKQLQVLSGVFFGLLVGLAIAYVLGLLVDVTADIYGPAAVAHPGPEPVLIINGGADAAAVGTSGEVAAWQREMDFYKADLAAFQSWQAFRKAIELTKLLLGSAAVFVCVSFVLQTKDSFRFIVPYVEFSKEIRGARPLLLDTSVIIDGRIVDVAETRILESNVIVPRFVLDELQAIADSADKLKRNRGRRGLDILSKLRHSEALNIQIMDVGGEDVEGETGVDSKLVALAKRVNGRVVTNDYNLNKVAQLRGVTVININDLSNAVKPVMLPGESMSVKIIRPGEEAGQGVGFLDDGTMVVVEGGSSHVEETVALTVTSALQTSAGRMIFGKLDS